MSRLPVSIMLLTVAGSIAILAGANTGQNSPAETMLPGARPVIDAAGFATLQNALDALPTAGGLVQLPAGTFEIDQPLRVPVGDVCIQGAGTATHIKNVNQEGKPALVVAHPQAGQNRKHELWRIRITNLRLTGNPQSGHGIEARHINEILLDAISVSNHGGDGIWLDFCYENPRINNCMITYNKGTGLNLVGCHDIVVSANQFEENQDALHCIDGFNLTMTGNNLDDHLGRGVVIENTYGSVVASNMIEECQSAAIVLGRDCYGITLSANVIAHNGAGVDLQDAHGCAVSANTFTLMKNDALTIGPHSGRIAVSGNSFCNSYIGQGKVRRGTNDRAAGGMALRGARNVGVTGNVFSSVRPKAFAVQTEETRQVLFAGNLLTDVTSDHEQLKDSLVDGNLETGAADE